MICTANQDSLRPNLLMRHEAYIRHLLMRHEAYIRHLARVVRGRCKDTALTNDMQEYFGATRQHKLVPQCRPKPQNLF